MARGLLYRLYMKNLKRIFSVCLALTTISATGFSQTLSFQSQEAYKATEQFLFNLGFEDYVQKAEKTLNARIMKSQKAGGYAKNRQPFLFAYSAAFDNLMRNASRIAHIESGGNRGRGV